MGVTIKDVAQRAGVTDTTVSLAFQPDSRVSERTRARVLAIAQDLGYVPNALARQLRGGNSRIPTLGLLVNDIANPFYGLIVRAAEHAALQFGCQVMVGDTQWNPEREVAVIHGMVEAHVDGVLACFSERTLESRALLERFDVPYLAIDSCPADYSGPYVINDLVVTGTCAAEHLLDAGYRRPAFFTAEAEMAGFSAFQVMQQAFQQTLAARGVTHVPVVIAGQTIANGAQAYETLLATHPEVDAVVCINTLCALGVMETADRHGIRIGQDVGVLGVDDLYICGLSRIGLSAIRQPYEQLAETAMQLLIHHMRDKTALTEQLTLPPTLVARQSTCRE
ncbi:MAG TPA: LacI family DNA-binding transcriptional regulator [Armatimonadota bacterium]